MFRKLVQPIYTLYVILIFVIIFGSFLLPIVFISFGNNKACRKAIWKLLQIGATVLLWLYGMPVRKTGRIPRGRYIFVANHISYIDAVVLFPTIDSYWRALGKKEMSKIPGFGYVYKQVVLMVDRSSNYSRSKSMRLMYRILKHESSIAIFPEGTFNEGNTPLKSFYDGAFKLALNTKTDIIPIIYPDTKQRWHYSAWWKIWPGKNRAIILDPVPVAGLTTADTAILKERVYNVMDAAMRRYSDEVFA